MTGGEVDLVLNFKVAARRFRERPEVPTRFLAFHPDYVMRDLTPTSIRHAETALKIAGENGLVEVSLGNWWLLGDYY